MTVTLLTLEAWLIIAIVLQDKQVKTPDFAVLHEAHKQF